MKRKLLVSLLAASVGVVGLARESMISTANGIDGFRPTPAQAEGVTRIELFCHARNVGDDAFNGPVSDDLERHVAREVRRLFPNLKYTNSSTRPNPHEAPKDKHVYLSLLINGSGMSTDFSAIHADARLTIIDPANKKSHRAAPICLTLAAPKEEVIQDAKKGLTKVLETIADGWHEPRDPGEFGIQNYSTQKYESDN